MLTKTKNILKKSKTKKKNQKFKIRPSVRTNFDFMSCVDIIKQS